jgi:phosphoenolpyruvate carboxykinase (GTP)
MLEKKIGVDIVAEIGGIREFESAGNLFKNKMDSEHFQRINQIRNQEAILKIANAIAMCDPDSVFINTGSEADRHFIRELSLKKAKKPNWPSKTIRSILI